MQKDKAIIMTRRELLRLMAFGGTGAVLTACGVSTLPTAVPGTAVPQVNPTAMPAATTAAGAAVTRAMPADAAPAEQQIFREMTGNFGTHIEWVKTVYNSAPGGHYSQIALVRLNQDFEMVPDAAESWEVSDDHLTWTFHIRKGLVWSDGAPLNANDFVWTFRRAANPKTAYDAGFFFELVAGIKNWTEVSSGKLPVEELGVVAKDDYTLQITTKTPRPFFVQTMKEGMCSPKQAFDKYGEDWSADLKTMVFSGPYIVSEWVNQDHITLVPNPTYNGPLKPYLSQYTYVYGQAENAFPAYVNNEIDLVVPLSISELKRAQADPTLSSALHAWPHWREFYITMDTTKPPFNDLKVRQALAHAIDVDTLCNTTLKDTAYPNRTMLMPGFPAYSADLQSVQAYDLAKAKQLLADAGFPDGKGFPTVELWSRGGDLPLAKTAGEFIQAQMKQNLGIDIGFREVERKTFTDAINAHTHNFFIVPYEYDYVDASNLLDLFLPGSRHAWENAKYTELVTQADGMFGDEAKRTEIYQQAERILVEDIGCVFLFGQLDNALWRPYLAGPAVSKNKQGLTTWTAEIADAGLELYVAKH